MLKKDRDTSNHDENNRGNFMVILLISSHVDTHLWKDHWHYSMCTLKLRLAHNTSGGWEIVK